MILSKLKEAIICLGAGRVTLPYPFAPRPPRAGFRGHVSWHGEVHRLRRLRQRLHPAGDRRYRPIARYASNRVLPGALHLLRPMC